MSSLLTINIDGASSGNPGPAGIGVVLKGENNFKKEVSRYIGEATNNVAEYEALICALEEAWELKYSNIIIHTDSQLLVNQLGGKYKIKSENIKPLYDKARKLLSRFSRLELKQVKREHNTEADKLATQAVKKQIKKSRPDDRSVVFYHGEESPSSTEQRSG